MSPTHNRENSHHAHGGSSSNVPNNARKSSVGFKKRMGFLLTVVICVFATTISLIWVRAGAAGTQLLKQDFSSSTVVADYVSATPNNGQFNAIGTSGAGVVVSINSGTLQYARAATNTGSFSRTTDLSPTPTSLIYKVDINVSGNTVAQTSAAVFQVGTAFGTANSAESITNTYARFAINTTATNGTFQIRDITNGTNSASFSGTQTITWALNNSGATLTYLAPDGTQESIADDRADIWIGTTRSFNDVAIETGTQSITDLKFAFTLGTATIQLDNFLIDPLPAFSYFRSAASGNWNSTATWEMSSDNVTFTAATITPNSSANSITIRSPHVVTVSADVNADQLTVNPGATLNVDSSITLTIDDGPGIDDMTVNGSANVIGTGIIGGAGSFVLSSGSSLGIGSAAGITSSGATGSIQTASRSFSTGANYSYNGGNQNTGSGLPATVNNLTINGNICGLTNDVTINGDFALTGVQFDAGIKSVTLKGNYSNPSGIYAGSTGGLLTFAGSTAITGNGTNLLPSVTIAPGSSLNQGTATIGVLGDWLDNATVGGPSGNTGGTTKFNPSLAVTRTIGGTVTAPKFNNLEIAAFSPAIVKANKGLDIDGSLSITSGTFDDGGFTHTVQGDWNKTGGTTYTATGTITFDGTLASNIQASNFNHLSVNKNSQATVVMQTGITTVAANLTVTTGTFDQGSAFDLTANGISVIGGATLKNLGTGDLKIGTGGVSNAGTITFNANGTPCPGNDDILIRSSVTNTQRLWTGAGTFNMTDVDVKDQAGTAIIVATSSTNTGNNGPNWIFVPGCTAGNTYTWSPAVGGDWNVPINWTPARNTKASNDILIIDNGFNPTITNVAVPSPETIAVLRVLNGTLVTLTAPPGGGQLDISGSTGSDLQVEAGSTLALGGNSDPLTINIASGSKAVVAGNVLFQDNNAHRMLGNAANAITFQSGSLCTTDITYSSTVNPFGSGTAGNGTALSVIFTNGSQYIHNNGGSPFGALFTVPGVAVFEAGSTAQWLTSNGFQASDRTYSNLIIGASNVATSVSDSNTGVFQFDNLTVNSTGAANSSLTYSGGSNINVLGDIVSTGVGNGMEVPDVTLLTSGGTIVIDKPGGGTINFSKSGGSNRTVRFEGAANVTSGTTLALMRKLIVGQSQPNSVITVIGALTGGTAGYVIGKEKRGFTAPELFIYHVGTTSGYSPLDANVTAGTGDLTVEARQPSRPGLNPATSLQRYWTLSEGGAITADLTFHYSDPPDVMGNESNYQLVVFDVVGFTFYPGTVNAAANTITKSNVTTFSDWTAAEPQTPTAVKLTGFTAVQSSTQNGPEVMLQWQTGYEARNLGYIIYREQDGKRVPITPSLIAGSALIAGNQTRLTAGLNYTWYDQLGQKAAGSKQKAEVTSLMSPVTYWLEDVDLDGTRTLHGPIAPWVTYRLPKERAGRADLINEVSQRTAASGVQFNGWPEAATDEQTRPRVALGRMPETPNVAATDPADLQRQIAAKPGVKIGISRPGWYRIGQPELIAAGLDPNIDSSRLQLYANGLPVAIKQSHQGESFDSSDYIEFYGYGSASPTDAAQTYYLVLNDSPGTRIRDLTYPKPRTLGELGDGSFTYTVERKERMTYFSGLLNGDAENFFGQIVSTTPASAIVPVTHLNHASQVAGTPAQLEVALQGVTNQDHLVQVRFNGTDIGTLNFANTEHPVQTLSVPAGILLEGTNTVQLTSLSGAADINLMDTLRLTYAHSYVADDDALSINVINPGLRRVDGFTNRDVRVVDLSDQQGVAELTNSVIVKPNLNRTYSASVQVPGVKPENQHTLVMFTDQQAQPADSVTRNDPSSWWSQTAGADYVIISTRSLKANVEPLAQLRRNQGLVVQVVDVEDLYDEFSFGSHSPQAIHDFLETATNTWTRKPHYVLLAGDASYDPKNYFGQGFNDLVPTKLIDTALTETASDDWLSDFNHDGIADLAMGRLPVRTLAHIDTMVNKIVTYENTAPDTSRGALLVADTGFEAPSNAVRNLLPAGLPVQTINRSGADDATIHNQIVAGINQGPRVANYLGHGSNGVWTGASLLSSNDAPSFTNTSHLSVFTMMTCYNGFFQDAYNDSLSEALLKSQGGAVAVWASTTLTQPGGQNLIAQEFYRLLFGAQPATLGDAARTAKVATADADVRRTWTLFGDPAMRLR